jgi:transposase-like protein
VAVRHGLHRNQIFAWRRQLRNHPALIEGAMPQFVPVALASPAEMGAASAGGSSRIGDRSGADDPSRHWV